MEIFKDLFIKALKSKNPDKNSELISLFVLHGNDLKEQINQYKEDFKKYKTGVFLWANDEYPFIVKLIEIFLNSDIKSKIPVLTNMKNVVDEYYKFIEKVKQVNNELFEEELNETKELFFDKTIRPTNILKKKNPFIGYVIEETTSVIDIITPQIKERFQKYLPSVSKNIESYTEELKPHLLKNVNILKSSLENKIPLEEFKKILEKENLKLDKIIEKFKIKSQEIANAIQKENEENNQFFGEVSERMENIKILSLKVLGNNQIKLIYAYIILIKDIDSYNIQFVKFLLRLYHILIKNNRDFKADKNCFFLISPKKFDFKTRENLKKFLAMSLRKKFPQLSNFLIKCFKYNKFRRLDAHEIPDIIKISNDNEVAYIPQTGNKEDLKMNIELIKTMINTYSFFIEALNIS